MKSSKLSSNTNDQPGCMFNVSKTLLLKNIKETEKSENGAYTLINNCSWFAGNLLAFEQDFDGARHADNWRMPFLNSITKIANTGMIAKG